MLKNSRIQKKNHEIFMWHSRPLEVYFIAGPPLSQPHFLTRLIQQKTTITFLIVDFPLLWSFSFLCSEILSHPSFFSRSDITFQDPSPSIISSSMSLTYPLLLLENLFFLHTQNATLDLFKLHHLLWPLHRVHCKDRLHIYLICRKMLINNCLK